MFNTICDQYFSGSSDSTQRISLWNSASKLLLSYLRPYVVSMTSGITCSEKTNSIAYNFMEVINGMHIVISGTDGKENPKV